MDDIFGILNEEKDKIENNDHLLPSKETKCPGEEKKWRCGVRFCDFLERERERVLLSRFSVNRTVGFFRAKKKSGSTQRGQRMGTSFEEFRQTP